MSLTDRKKADSAVDFKVISNDHPVAANARPRVENDVIDLVDLAYMLLDKLHYIILCFLIGALVFNAYAYLMIAPTYSSTAKMYIVSASNDSVVDLTDLNIGTSLTADYEELILGYPVLEQVIDELGLDMTSTQLSGMVAISNPENTRVLNIKVTSTSPEEARDIANKLVEVSVEYLPKTMSTNAPNVVQKAKLATQKAGPSYTRYTMMGAVLGAVLYCAYLTFMYLMDDTLHTPEDVEKYFGIVPLTVIPDNEIFDEDKKSHNQKKSLFWRRKHRK